MTYNGSPADNTSLLLIPSEAKVRRPTAKIAVLDRDVFERKAALQAAGVQPKFTGEVPGTGGTRVCLVAPTDGVPFVFVNYDDFEREQPPPKVLSISEEIQAYVAMAKDDEN